ncbi:MAG: tetratricopeptide repeat protein [Terriglobales bacterium]
MRIALSSPLRKGTFLIGCAASLLLVSALSLQAITEHWLANSTSTVLLERAARLQPLNAEIQEKLGIVYADPAHADFQQAASHFQRAVEINPHSSRTWLNLANTYIILGDDERSADAVRHALIAEPKDTQVQWEAANLFIGTDLNRALELLRGVVENDPAYGSAAMEVAYTGSGKNVDKVMLAVPLTTAARLQLMHWLMERNDADGADKVWPTVMSAPGTLKARDAFFYIDSLIERRQVELAANAWSGLVQKDPGLRVRTQPGNLVLNGDFEGDLLNGGFAWRYVPTTGVSVSLDTSTFHSGTRSLSLQIDGENLPDFGVRELIKVQPGALYRLAGWLHAEKLEGAHGVSISVSDAYSHARLLLTDEVVGSFPWRQVDGLFAVPADTKLLELAFVRSPGNGRIRGRVWIDDLRIEKK